jgi:hypothetical protein
MEPNRFDDVEVRIVEEPAAPRAPRRTPQRRLGHAAIALTAVAVVTGTLAASATALTSTAQAPTRAADQSQSGESYHKWGKRDGKCRKGEGHRRAAALDY